MSFPYTQAPLSSAASGPPQQYQPQPQPQHYPHQQPHAQHFPTAYPPHYYSQQYHLQPYAVHPAQTPHVACSSSEPGYSIPSTGDFAHNIPGPLNAPAHLPPASSLQPHRHHHPHQPPHVLPPPPQVLPPLPQPQPQPQPLAQAAACSGIPPSALGATRPDSAPGRLMATHTDSRPSSPNPSTPVAVSATAAPAAVTGPAGRAARSTKAAKATKATKTSRVARTASGPKAPERAQANSGNPSGQVTRAPGRRSDSSLITFTKKYIHLLMKHRELTIPRAADLMSSNKRRIYDVIRYLGLFNIAYYDKSQGHAIWVGLDDMRLSFDPATYNPDDPDNDNLVAMSEGSVSPPPSAEKRLKVQVKEEPTPASLVKTEASSPPTTGEASTSSSPGWGRLLWLQDQMVEAIATMKTEGADMGAVATFLQSMTLHCLEQAGGPGGAPPQMFTGPPTAPASDLGYHSGGTPDTLDTPTVQNSPTTPTSSAAPFRCLKSSSHFAADVEAPPMVSDCPGVGMTPIDQRPPPDGPRNIGSLAAGPARLAHQVATPPSSEPDALPHPDLKASSLLASPTAGACSGDRHHLPMFFHGTPGTWGAPMPQLSASSPLHSPFPSTASPAGVHAFPGHNGRSLAGTPLAPQQQQQQQQQQHHQHGNTACLSDTMTTTQQSVRPAMKSSGSSALTTGPFSDLAAPAMAGTDAPSAEGVGSMPSTTETAERPNPCPF
ncbi:hypothetical protein H696_01163 [Fonticula alba]|uniref:E2F/DP family winged-helix DNA-binding domain-containing protein n=1 Tax=Fonticula alba TaxID=691883 RepID=A0A058ZE55_FONAL|nr:hypothetical protein H696_01163 [Fonticula alba]KCV71742.1 hypothetical protein H696_01163 [Fonticula alba]|eukprot:XP_009493320.1 hypothetical protein H696_01163 [Fonticula alba]